MEPPAPNPSAESGTSLYDVGPPRLDEAAALGELHVAVWRDAYAGLMARRHLDALDPAARAGLWRAVAEAVDETGWAASVDDTGRATGYRALVARHGGRLVGMITVGTPHDAEPPAPVELWSLNVAAEHHGRGVARALVVAALPEGPAYLWVLRGNARAIAFYAKWGFALDGTEKYDPTYDVVDLRMTRA